jgi:ubiquinone/menaquinone biosynthesis C-methylase UbiE
VDYLGTDVVPGFLAYAQERCPGWRFDLVESLKIPAPDASADFVFFFSVLTHLSHQEGGFYLSEAKRVLRPGGKIVTSFIRPLEWGVKRAAELVFSQVGRSVTGVGHKNTLTTMRHMRRHGELLGMRATFLGQQVGQSVCVFTSAGESAPG